MHEGSLAAAWELTKALMTAPGLDLNEMNAEGQSALHVAASMGRAGLVKVCGGWVLGLKGLGGVGVQERRRGRVANGWGGLGDGRGPRGHQRLHVHKEVLSSGNPTLLHIVHPKGVCKQKTRPGMARAR